MSQEVQQGSFIPLAEAALELQLNREQVLRRIQCGKIIGRQDYGRWFVERASLDAYKRHLGLGNPTLLEIEAEDALIREQRRRAPLASEVG